MSKLPSIRELISSYYDLVERELLEGDSEELAVEKKKLANVIMQKADNVRWVYLEFKKRKEQIEAEKKVLYDEIKRLSRRAEVMEKAWELLKYRFIDILEATGQKRLKTPAATYSVVDVAGSLEIVDQSKVPTEFIKIVQEIDKKGLRKHVIKHGGDVGYAKVERKKSLRIT